MPYARHALLPGEVARVDAIAQDLHLFLHQHDEEIDSAHVFGAQSAVIRAILGRLLAGVGFASEVLLTP